MRVWGRGRSRWVLGGPAPPSCLCPLSSTTLQGSQFTVKSPGEHKAIPPEAQQLSSVSGNRAKGGVWGGRVGGRGSPAFLCPVGLTTCLGRGAGRTCSEVGAVCGVWTERGPSSWPAGSSGRYLAGLRSPGSDLAPILICNDHLARLLAELVSPPSSLTGQLLWLSQPGVQPQALWGWCGRGLCISFPAIPSHSATFLCHGWREGIPFSWPLFLIVPRLLTAQTHPHPPCPLPDSKPQN